MASGVGVERCWSVVTHQEPVHSNYAVNTKELAEGTYAKVYRAQHRQTGLIRAIKQIDKATDEDITGGSQFEAQMLKKLDHPNVTKLLEVYEDGCFLYLVLELCTGGDLFEAIVGQGAPSEVVCQHLVRQMATAVHYIHSRGICHRDVKPENFLLGQADVPLQQSTLKLIDFGLSALIPLASEPMTDLVGTAYYISPQVLQGSYTQACDIWSLGAVIYLMLCGYPPFNAQSDQAIVQLIMQGEFSFDEPEWEFVSADAKDLIAQMLQLDQGRRISGKQAKEHRWLNCAAARNLGSMAAKVVGNLKRFRAQGLLKKMALHLIAAQLDESQIQTRLRDAFVRLDWDGDGKLSAKELQQAIKGAELRDMPPEWDDLIAEAGKEGEKVVEYTEFLAATVNRRLLLQEDVCRAAFNTFSHGEGVITGDGLQRLLSEERVKEVLGDQETVGDMLKEAGNREDVMDFPEFMAMLAKNNLSFSTMNTSIGLSSHPTSITAASLGFSVTQVPHGVSTLVPSRQKTWMVAPLSRQCADDGGSRSFTL